VYVMELCSETPCTIESCALEACASICQPPPINIKVCPDKVQLDCNGDSDGQISVWAIGGTLPYTYTLYILPSTLGSGQLVTGPQTSATFSDLPVGNYQVLVTDSNGCTGTELFSITQPSLITVTIITINDECGTRLKAIATGGTICNNSSNGCNSSCATDCYKYEWVNTNCPNNIITTTNPTGPLVPGAYMVTAYDSKCCSGQAGAEISCNPSLCVKVKKHCNDACTFRIKVCVSYGCPPYRYEVNGACLDDDIEEYDFLLNSHFTLKVTDSKGYVGSTVF